VEQHGTDTANKYRYIEGEVHSLRGEIGDIRTETKESLAEVRASVGILARGQEDTQNLVRDLGTKLDEQRTKRPDLIAIFGAVLGLASLGVVLLGGMWTLFQAQLAPMSSTMAENTAYIRQINNTIFTQEDFIRSSESRTRELESLIADNEEDKERILQLLLRVEAEMHDRILYLERENHR
jgi:hypothetical protein